MLKSVLVSVLVATLVTPVADLPADAAAVVHTATGDVRGVNADQVRRYLGIPYAAPPVGQLRWKPPQAGRPWSGVRAANHSGPACAQGDEKTSTGSEDCLYVDVTAPKTTSRVGKPVVVWFHGGGLSSGTGSEIDAARMVEQSGVIVVSVDFRLGIFGLFGLPGLAGSGDFYLQDQQAALRWVRQNIGAFGGNPGNVTIAGQSGGAVAVCGQLTSPTAAGLFDRAVMQSGSCLLDWPDNGLAENQPAGSFWMPVGQIASRGTAAAKALNCPGTAGTQLVCLRRLSPAQVLAQNANFIAAGYGTPNLPLNPATALKAGLFNRVPVLAGHNRNEMLPIAGIYEWAGAPITDYPGKIGASFEPVQAAAVIRHYPAERYGSAGAAYYTVISDRVFICPQLETDRILAAQVPTYTYEFSDEHAPPYIQTKPDYPAGASHAAELMYLFDIAGKPVDIEQHPLSYTPAQRALAATMISYWAQFARTGNPNDGGLPAWQRATPTSRILTLAPKPVGIGTTDAYDAHQCGFWRALH
jgi:para-nitrobenzyl esterase